VLLGTMAQHTLPHYLATLILIVGLRYMNIEVVHRLDLSYLLIQSLRFGYTLAISYIIPPSAILSSSPPRIPPQHSRPIAVSVTTYERKYSIRDFKSATKVQLIKKGVKPYESEKGADKLLTSHLFHSNPRIILNNIANLF
jgi:hypothetical protein